MLLPEQAPIVKALIDWLHFVNIPRRRGINNVYEVVSKLLPLLMRVLERVVNQSCRSACSSNTNCLTGFQRRSASDVIHSYPLLFYAPEPDGPIVVPSG
jgi:hypothetical protein